MGAVDENGDPIPPGQEPPAGDETPPKPGEKPVKTGKVPPKPGGKAPAKAGDKSADTGSKKKPEPAAKAAGLDGLGDVMTVKAARTPPPEALSLSVDRPKALRAVVALKKAIKPILAEMAVDVASQVERQIEKADEDPEAEALRIVKTLDLQALLALEEPLFDELLEIGEDTVRIALASIGIEDPAAELVDRVNEAAVTYARERAAELVSVEGDQNLIDATREMIRRVIADGLENNIGRNAIADAVQESQAFSDYRAGLIADTEISFANGNAKAAAWGEAKSDGAEMVKEWFVSGESGVCEECEGNEAQGEIPFDEAFESGDDMEPAHPGCRCVTTARVLEPGASEETEE